MVPLIIDLAGRHVVIFGGGAVGLRKATYFCREAEVTVVSRSFLPEFSGLDVRCLEADLSDMDDDALAVLLDGAFLVVAATSDEETNNHIGRTAREAGALFNNARGDGGDTLIPSVVRGEEYLIAVSTGGASPAVPRFLREHLEAAYPYLDAMIRVEARLRDALKQTVPDQAKRAAVLRAVLHDPDAWTWLADGEDRAYERIQERYM
ncbi:bifunctional precorrin-2 dehydrogenase/sirohydrochlorin ferrochelatase [Methanofollis formosanus]|uniref:precorrin-2 dehydrogenase n=1 Tax=Methanofollis formosanus TaxID=299308 RepID=A0A8G1EEW2_9EURY|nr:bifunctional precorrin-2 dehydrogenase/sirohydrochlorin ferrochelatase [Methanofollis formosanus]QYZ78330.1 bifunctional precorrin-2 dehydrogenase/sirohydrochlorin ferrochelatase [Methanofollis formosanus]